VAGTLAALAWGLAASAQTQTLFTDDFEDGNSTGWSKSGGTWSVVTDGTKVYKQSSTSSDARARAGSSSWTNYAVQARVKPLSFNGTDRFVALVARAQGNTSYYYLTLRNSNQIELKKLVSGSSTTLASKAFTVTAGTWYTLRIEAVGSSLSAYVNGTLQLSATDTQFTSGNVGGATFYAAAEFDDFVVTALSTTPTPTPTPAPTPAPTPTPTPTPAPTPAPTPDPGDGPVGYASVNALGQNGTTGGAGGPVVTVSNATQLLDYIFRTGPYVVQVDGMITVPAAMHKVASDKTIVGLGSNSGISGGGLNMTNGVKNVIIRNLRFINASDDSVNIQESSHHVWIDHCDFSFGYDGLLDIKRGSDYVTVSWNHFHDHDKTMLLGHDDANAAQDLGHLRVTYHHNWFDGTVQRHPRVRFAEPVHVFNNYYFANSGYGVASTMNAGVLVEGNYFENVQNPTVIQTGTSDPGRLVQRNNVFAGSGAPQTAGSVSEPSAYYSYTLDNPADVKSIVTAGAGVGKLGF
jgi:pectate lyase